MGDGVADGRLDVVGLGHFGALQLHDVEDLPAGVDIRKPGEAFQLVLKQGHIMFLLNPQVLSLVRLKLHG